MNGLVTVARYIATILSGPLLILGVIFSLQGLGFLPGKVMHGVLLWTIIGIPMALCGGVLLVWVNRRAA